MAIIGRKGLLTGPRLVADAPWHLVLVRVNESRICGAVDVLEEGDVRRSATPEPHRLHGWLERCQGEERGEC